MELRVVCIEASTYVLNERTLVLEGVTLGKVVELVVEVLVDLAAGTVLDKEAAKHTLAAHPEDLTLSRQYKVSVEGMPSSSKMELRTTYVGIRALAVPFLLPKPR